MSGAFWAAMMQLHPSMMQLHPSLLRHSSAEARFVLSPANTPPLPQGTLMLLREREKPSWEFCGIKFSNS
jgi:hypothetical protein